MDALSRCLRIRKLLIPHHHHTAFTFHRLGTMMALYKIYTESM